MTIQQARLLSLALNEIQDKLLQDYNELLLKLKTTTDNEVITITMDGGAFREN